MIDISLDLKKETEKKFKKILMQYSDQEQFVRNIIDGNIRIKKSYH